MKTIRTLAAIAAIIAIAGSCKKEINTHNEYVDVSSVSLNESEIVLIKGDSELLKATVLPKKATDKSVTWNSSATSVASVDQDGLVTALNYGTAIISAVSNWDASKNAKCTVEVVQDPVPLTGFGLSPGELLLKAGDSNYFNPKFTPANTTERKLTWHSSNESIATVDEDGNEVYYPEDGEEYEGDDQTGGVSQQSVPETDRGAVSASGGTRAQAGRAASGPEATALAGSGASNGSEYILPDSNSRLYTREELSGLDDNTLQLAINEIYARHGRKFNTESMQAYFDGKSWYSGTVDPEVFDGNEAAYFNEYEIKNRELLSSIRAERQEAAGTAGQQL